MTIIYATHIFDGLEDWMTHLLYLCNGTIQRAMLRRVACSWRAHTGQIERFCAVDSVDELTARRKEGSVAPLMRTVETWLRKEQRDKPPRKRCERLIPAPTS